MRKREIVERPKIDLGCENHQILCVEKDGAQVAKIRLGRGTLAGRSFSDKYVVTIAPYISRFLYQWGRTLKECTVRKREIVTRIRDCETQPGHLGNCST